MDINNMDRREFIRLLEAGALTFGSMGIAGGALAQQRIFKVAYWMGPRHSLARTLFGHQHWLSCGPALSV